MLENTICLIFGCVCTEQNFFSPFVNGSWQSYDTIFHNSYTNNLWPKESLTQKKITWHAQVRQFLRHSHLHRSSTPDSGRTTREGQDGCSKGTVARGRKLGKGSARAAEGAVPVFSSDLPNSPGCAATQTSQFNIRSSQVRPRKKVPNSC